MPGPIDTDMVRDLAVPKTSADSSRADLVGIERGEEEIFPDPLAEQFAEGARTGQGQGVRAPERRGRPDPRLAA